MEVIIAEDYPLYRLALGQLLVTHCRQPRIHEAGDMRQLQKLLRNQPAPDLLIVSASLQGMSGDDTLQQIRADHPLLRIVALTDALETEAMLHAPGTLVRVPKSATPETMLHVITDALAHRQAKPAIRDTSPRTPGPQSTSHVPIALNNLTPRQRSILEHVACGMQNKQIAHALGLQESTIKSHVSQLMKTLKVRNRTQIVIACVQWQQSMATGHHAPWPG